MATKSNTKRKATTTKKTSSKSSARKSKPVAKKSARKVAPKAKTKVKLVVKARPASAKAKTNVKGKPAAKAKTTQQALAKKSKSTPAKVAKKTASKASVKAAPKSAVKVQKNKVAVAKPAPKAVAKAPAPKLAAKIAMKPVERKPFDRAPAPAQKAPMNVVARPHHHHHGRPVIAPHPVTGKKLVFAVGEYVVYPTHGVGRILGLESEKIGDFELKVFVIAFEKDKMTLRVPVGRAEAAGLRSISSNDQIVRALSTLKGRAKIARGMWSRRAQEYEAKINSGNLVAIAEVVRDLHKNVDQSERSYSERMIYETAMHRLCGEVAASERVDIKDAQDRLLKVLRKQAAEAA